MIRSYVFFVFMALATAMFGSAGCAQNSPGESQDDFGRVSVTASALTSAGQITSLTVESGTSIATLALDAPTGKYKGSLVLPSGSQTITARAYAGTQQVGVGTANVVIVANTTTVVTLRVLDTTGGNPQPDAGAFIVSLASLSASPVAGQATGLRVDAVDANRDPLTYEWTSSCGGSFSAQAASTSWTPSASGPCKITVVVTSNGLSDSESIDLVVFEAGSTNGGLTIEAEYVPNPRVSALQIYNGQYCTISPTALNSMCPEAVVAGSRPLDIYLSYESYGTTTVSLVDDCGGTIVGYASTYYSYQPVAGLCTLTATVSTTDGLSSSLSASIYVK